MSWQVCLRGHLLSKCQEDLALFDVGTSLLEPIHIAALEGVSQVSEITHPSTVPPWPREPQTLPPPRVRARSPPRVRARSPPRV
jgi:hypothetical protein